MNHRRKTLLAGIAALGLIAGTSLVSAQDASKDQGSQNKQPHATQQMNQTPGAGKMGQSAQDQNRGSTAHQPNQRSEDNGRTNKGEKAATEEQRKGGATAAERDEIKSGKGVQSKDRVDHSNTAQDRDRMKGKNATEGEHKGKATEQKDRTGRENNNAAQREHNGTKGLQGNASGMHAQLTEEQRTHIRSTVINAAGAPRVSSVNFDVTVGTVVPRNSIHVIAVPETLVQIEPEWRGFLYFVYEDEVVIVNPRDMRIVAVVPV